MTVRILRAAKQRCRRRLIRHPPPWKTLRTDVADLLRALSTRHFHLLHAKRWYQAQPDLIHAEATSAH